MEWKTTPGLTDYPHALEVMAARVAAIQKGEADELIWLVEHPPLYTLGTSAKREDVLERDIPAFETGRGGQVTYHGPGQRVVYLMFDLRKRAGERGQEPDLRAYVQQLEQWMIATLAAFGVEGFTREGRVGVWVNQSPVASRQSPVKEALGHGGAASPLPAGEVGFAQSPLKRLAANPGEGALTNHEAKIAALGVRVQKWVTSHGIALNVHPDLSHYAGIVPCGLREFGVTSLHALGVTVGMEEVDAVLRERWGEVGG